MKRGEIQWNKISLFEGLPVPTIDKIKPIFEVRSVESGRDLITEGEPGDEMFILIHGRVRILKSMLLKDMDLPLMEVDNPRKTLATLDQRSYPVFGEIALIDKDIRSATIQVLEDAVFLVTNRHRFFELAEKEPALGSKLLMAIARRMAGTIRKSNGELIKVSTALALALSRYKTMP